MFYKLAFNNIKKSYKDYLIYFVTLTMGITLFYLFNSIESQKMMLDLGEIKADSLRVVFGAMNYISIFISLALAFLMLYANRFLIKRRKKELGIYLLLGMDRMKVSSILVLETMMIGAISLVVGIVIGVIGSHFFSLITARMFMVDVKEFRFIFSPKAAFKTCLFFGLIFGIDIILNTWSISRLKLINLLYARRRNQELAIKKNWVYVIIFILSIISLGIAYHCIMVNGMMSFDNYFKTSIIMGIIGTCLFFMSLTGIAIPLIQKKQSLYFNDLNIFTVRQIGSKVNSTYILVSIVCIMLLIAIGTFSTGMGMADVMSATLDKNLPFDDGYYIWDNGEIDYEKELSRTYLEQVDYAVSTFYHLDINLHMMMDQIDYNALESDQLFYYSSLEAMSIGDYNAILELLGEKPLVLSDNEYMFNYSMDKLDEMVAVFGDDKPTVTIGDKTLVLKMVDRKTTLNVPMARSNGTIIIPDHMVDGMRISAEVINVNYRDKAIDLQNQHENLKEYLGYSLSKERILAESLGIRTVLSYFAIYVGIVFIMSSVVILALQLLTEASDNVERYQLLMKLGVEEMAIKKSLFAQISVYFMMPLLLGIIHSYVGLSVSTEAVRIVGSMDIFSNLMTTAVFVILIYGAYFIVTYTTIKAIVLRQR